MRQGRRKHLKLGGGGSTLRGHFSLKKKEGFPRNERAFLCLLQKIFEGAPAPSAPGFYVYVMRKDTTINLFWLPWEALVPRVHYTLFFQLISCFHICGYMNLCGRLTISRLDRYYNAVVTIKVLP